MRSYNYKKVVLFFIVWIIIISFCHTESAFSYSCSSCVSACRGLPGCCTGYGCICEGCSWGCETPTPALSSPANGLTGVPVNPTLVWSNVSGASSYDVRVCSDSACSSIVASSSVSVSQWQVSPALNPGTTYWWQVRANKSCAGSWSTTRSFTTICSAPSPPGTPNLSSPANDDTVVSTPTLDWDDVACASSYDVRVCSDSACSSVAASSSVTVSQWQVSPAFNPSTSYWWQVRAKNSYGNGPWSTARKFTTSSDTPLSNGIPLNASITGVLSRDAWKYYYVDIPSGATSFIVDLYNLSKDADLYVRSSSKPSSSSYNCRPYKGGTTSEECISSERVGQNWTGA